MPMDFGTIPYRVTEITRFINQQNSVPFIHKSAGGPTLLPHPGTPCLRKSQIQAIRITDYSISAAAKAWSASIIIHQMWPQGKRPFLFQICLQWDPDPGVLLFRSAAVLMHYHTNKNETGPCVQLSWTEGLQSTHNWKSSSLLQIKDAAYSTSIKWQWITLLALLT